MNIFLRGVKTGLAEFMTTVTAAVVYPLLALTYIFGVGLVRLYSRRALPAPGWKDTKTSRDTRRQF